MLYIDNKKFEIVSQIIYVGEFLKNLEKGYNICIQLQFINLESNEKGYINLDAGFEKTADINLFLNREYSGEAFNSSDNQFIYLEVFDTEEFLDTDINGRVIINIRDMKDNKIEVSFEVNDELIKIKYAGYLDIDFKKTKDTFLNY